MCASPDKITETVLFVLEYFYTYRTYGKVKKILKILYGHNYVVDNDLNLDY
jgi:hypothetical protein